MSFNKIPVLSLADAYSADKKPRFLECLREALINVGFLLITDFEEHGPSHQNFERIKTQAVKFFSLPDHVKTECEMINSPQFLGYTRLANEITGGKADWREQIDLATELPEPKEGEPLYKQIEGPNLWPRDEFAPEFRPVVTAYIEQMTKLSKSFRGLICEAIGLPPDGFDSYFKENQQCKMKLIAYPEKKDTPQSSIEGSTLEQDQGQGVGAHRDSDFFTFIYQASDHKGSLQVQNFQGDWIPIDNVQGSLVVAVGQTLEAITKGVCKATIHKVTSPQGGSGTRLSIPFFQTIDLDAHKSAISDIPQEILKLKDRRDKLITNWGSNIGFQFTPGSNDHPIGYAVFRNRIKSHQDVAAKWYPEILEQVLRGD